MKKSAIDQDFLSVLVSAYNQSIQTYFYFPDVVICGSLRLDRQQFDRLVTEEFVEVCKADSFGRYYRLSKKGEAFLLATIPRRRHKTTTLMQPPVQHALPFAEAAG